MGLLNLTVKEGIATIVLNNPPANAMSGKVFQVLKETLFQLEKDESATVIIIQGEGRFFSAGADIKEFLLMQSKEHAEQMAKRGQDFFEYVESFPKPIIAAIHGAALGGGLEFAMACHLRIASETAKLGLPELNLGIIPGFAGTQRLIRLVGKAKGLEMMLTGEAISGQEAANIGLINAAVKEEVLLDTVASLAKKIAMKSPMSVQAVLTLVQSVKTQEYYHAVDREAELFGEVFQSEDAKEGVTAFIEKRKPTFLGK